MQSRVPTSRKNSSGLRLALSTSRLPRCVSCRLLYPADISHLPDAAGQCDYQLEASGVGTAHPRLSDPKRNGICS